MRTRDLKITVISDSMIRKLNTDRLTTLYKLTERRIKHREHSESDYLSNDGTIRNLLKPEHYIFLRALRTELRKRKS